MKKQLGIWRVLRHKGEYCPQQLCRRFFRDRWMYTYEINYFNGDTWRDLVAFATLSEATEFIKMKMKETRKISLPDEVVWQS